MATTTSAAQPDETTTGRCPFAHPAAASATALATAPAGERHVEVTSVADLWQDQPIIDAIDRWAADREPDGLALARLITAHVRAIGKHFLSVPILARLSEIRREHGPRDRFLDAFLDGILDKYENRYYNRTYLELPLIEAICDDPRSGLDPDRMSALLIADVVRFETEATSDDRPDPQALRKRIAHALRFVAECGGADEQRVAGEWFAMTVQPVYTVHDEYFFIRALQAHEMVFTVLAADLRAATLAMREGSFEDTVAWLDHATAVFARAAMLFRLVATMRAEQFHAFREFTQGASAIQSEQYKRFEIACGTPTAERLGSDAFTNVPAVQADALAGHDNLSDAYLDARRDGTFATHEWDVIDTALGRLEAAHQRWKATHRSLAARMLGDASGSGYTSGVPYLQRCLTNRLFWRLGERYLDGSTMG